MKKLLILILFLIFFSINSYSFDSGIKEKIGFSFNDGIKWSLVSTYTPPLMEIGWCFNAFLNKIAVNITIFSETLYRKPASIYFCLNVSPDYLVGIEVGEALLIGHNIFQFGCGSDLLSKTFKINFQYGILL